MLIFGIVLQIDVQTIASYVSGININFQLHPPTLPASLDFMLGSDYRLKFYVVLGLIGLIKKGMIAGVVSLSRRWSARGKGKKLSQQKAKKE